MPRGLALEFSGVTKRFGAITAVSDLSARIDSGVVTGFLGPNGAGKTTSLRILLGLVRATAGSATVGGVPYAGLEHPLQTVGAVLEASSFHPGRTAANHLAVYARAAGIPRSRVDEVLGLVGLADAAGRKVGGFSLGMRQRLGLAYALLGDPGILVLDEPANGLDPEGIKWMRGFLRQLAHEGRTVLTSSHLLAEVQQTVDSLLVISQGRLVFQGGLDELIDPSEYATVVDSPDRAALGAALTQAGVPFEVLRTGLTVRGWEPVEVGAVAAGAGVALSALHRRGPALEEVFLELVNGTRVHPTGTERAGTLPAAAAAAAPAVEAHRPPEADVEAEPAPEPTALEGEAEDSPAEDAAHPDRSAAGFIVAGTGVIDVVPAEETDSAPEDETEAEVEGEFEHGSEAFVTSGADGAPAAAAEADEIPSVESDEESDGAVPPESSDSERPWEDYVKTDSDLEADAFFASFDAAQEAQARRDAEELAAAGGEDAKPDLERESEPEGAKADPGTDPDAKPPQSREPDPDEAAPEPSEHGDRNDGDEQR